MRRGAAGCGGVRRGAGGAAGCLKVLSRRTAQQAGREPEAEHGTFAEPEDHPGYRSEVGLTNQSSKRSQRGAGALGGVGDGVDGAAGEGTSEECDRQAGQAAADGGDERDAQVRLARRALDRILFIVGRDREAQPGTSSDEDAFQRRLQY